MSPMPPTARGADRRLLAAAVLPPVALAVAGAFHPRDLTAATAARWTDLHLLAVPLFGLLGLAPWLVLRRVSPALGVLGAVLGWVYAAFYTALDVLAGIGAGTLAQRAGGAGVGELFARGDQLAAVGTVAYLLAAALSAAVVLVTAGPGATGPGATAARARAVAGAVLTVAGATSYLDSHIWWPRGGLTMLALALGWALLAGCPPARGPGRGAAPQTAAAPAGTGARLGR